MLSDVWYDIECCKSLNIIKQLCPRDILTDKLQLLCVGSCTANLKTKRNHQKQTSMYFFFVLNWVFCCSLVWSM